MAKHPKHFIQIKNSFFQIGNDITIEEDLDVLYKTMSFTFPEVIQEGFNSLKLKKFDVVNLFFGIFDSKEEKEKASVIDCKQVFTGYIHEVLATENKVEGVTLTINCRSTLGLAYERTTITKSFDGLMATVITFGLAETYLLDIIPYAYISSDLDSVLIKISSTNNFGKVLESIKEKYPIKIFQTGDGGLWITTPQFFEKQNLSEGLVKVIKAPKNKEPGVILSTWNYDLQTNITSIDYGNTVNNINCVLCYGTNVVGAAYDPIAYETQYKTSEIHPQNLSVLTFYQFDIYSMMDCRSFAYNKLLDISKNYVITFDSYYRPIEQLGDLIHIKNSKLIDSEQFFTIKRRIVTINKNDINAQITVYRTGLTDLNISANTELANLLASDILNIQDKVRSAAIHTQLDN